MSKKRTISTNRISSKDAVTPQVSKTLSIDNLQVHLVPELKDRLLSALEIHPVQAGELIKYINAGKTGTFLRKLEALEKPINDATE